MKTPIDYVKRNRKSRSRGYSHEHKVVLDVNKIDGWFCRRLGGSSSDLPDIVATNTEKSRLIVAEFKSRTPKALKRSSNLASSSLYIPQDQAQRCIDMVRVFGVYKNREVVFAFKFSNPKTRVAIYYYFVLNPLDYGILMERECVIKCTSSGVCTVTYMNKDKLETIELSSRPYFL